MKTFKEIEREVILARLEELNGNRTHTARSLKIGLRTLQRKLKVYGIAPAAPYRSAQRTETARSEDL